MKNENKNEKNLRKLFVEFILSLVFVAICIALAFKFSPYGHELKINDYFTYAGTFGGAILGAGISIAILYITIQNSNKDREEDMLNAARPILKVYKLTSTTNNRFNLGYDNDGCRTCDNIYFGIKNIGVGPARSLSIQIAGYDVENPYNSGKIEFDLGVNEHIDMDIRTYFEDNNILHEDGNDKTKKICNIKMC